ncbi:hypothetical protein NDA02_25935 [Leptolyngbya sp. ST-U4]
MRTLAEAYPDEEVVQHSVAQLLWRHNIACLKSSKTPLNGSGTLSKRLKMAGAGMSWFYKLKRTCVIAWVARSLTSSGYFLNLNLILRFFSFCPNSIEQH